MIEYYRAVADAMLPHLAQRPLVLRRFPDGIDTKGFVQQDIGDHVPDWVQTADLPRRGGEGMVRHVVCEDVATLVYLANQAAIELHTWPSIVDDPEHPDRLVIDIDPPDGTELATLRTTARQVRDLCKKVGLVPFVQATGSRGFHVVAPLDRSADYEFVRQLAADLADHLAAGHPDELTTAHRKQRRGDRVFLDVGRNAYGQTFVAPYSLRARPGASAATPLDWTELGRATRRQSRPRHALLSTGDVSPPGTVVADKGKQRNRRNDDHDRDRPRDRYEGQALQPHLVHRGLPEQRVAAGDLHPGRRARRRQ
jgi:bifunctional non-homologous end joining protein LigD